MAKTYINGELVSSSTNYAAAIEYTKKDGSKTTVQDGIDNLRDEINNKIPFSFGIDTNGNYGYIKDGADTVTPFKKPCCYYSVYLTVHGTSAYGNISSSWNIDTSNWKTLILTGKMQDENNSSLVIKANSSSGTTIYTFSSRTNTTTTIDISNYNSIFMQVVCSRGLSGGAWGTYVGKIELN